jgi:hypothetical protein
LNSVGQWVFPAGVGLSPNAWLVVWCDPSRPASTNAEAELNTGFALNPDGGAVYLLTTNGQTADFIAFGPQVADLSIGRSAGNWVLLSHPTAGLANTTNAALGDPTNLRINEWMANPAVGSDWFELYNLGTLPVSLTGLYLTDDPSLTGMTQFQVPALSFIAGQDWALYQADSHPSQGPDHVNFSLNLDGETIRLYATNFALIDAMDFGVQSIGVSQGRLPDGGTQITSFVTTPTPGTSNRADDSDGDGIPDWWMQQYFGHLTGLSSDKTRAQDDYDGDGMSNLAEYLAGSNPTNSQSLLKINSLVLTLNGLTLGFTRFAGHTYTVQFRDNMASGSWQSLTNLDAVSVTEPVQVNDSAGGGKSARFYRLVTPQLP